MSHHQGNIFLGIIFHRRPFWNKHTNEFMIPFGGAFLVRCRCIAVEYMGAPVSLSVEFQCFGIGKFAAVVTKKKRHKSHKNIRPKLRIKLLEDVNDRLGVICIPQKCQHTFGSFSQCGRLCLLCNLSFTYVWHNGLFWACRCFLPRKGYNLLGGTRCFH